MNKREQIKQINDAYEAKIAEINARRAYRMQNYLDCVDDYSITGFCEVADSREAHRAEVTRDILIQQVNNGGHFVRIASEFILLDQDNNVVSDNLFNGQYGLCFRTNDNRYIGVPKRAATLEKKGYKIVRVDRTFKCVYGGWSDKGNLLYKSIELVSEEMVEGQMPSVVPDNYLVWSWRKQLNN